jgi:myosin protein heavy chain
MSLPAPNGPTWRKSPFSRGSSAQLTPTALASRPVSAILSPTSSPSVGHARHQSFSPLGTLQSQGLAQSDSTRKRSGSYRSTTPATGTFAPTFIKSEDPHKPIDGIEGENDFSGKRYVWLKDGDHAFVKGWIVEDLPGGRLLVQCDDGPVGKSPHDPRANVPSNEKSMRTMPTKSTPPSSTRPTTWRS